MFKLVISDDEGKQTVVPLVRDEITIGRKEGNTIRLTERNVSRRHARLVKANGKFVVEDLHSYNGVLVNGQRIGAETPLEPGDQISIGDYHLAVQVEGTETAVDHQIPAAQADTAMIAAPGPPARLVMITPPTPGAEFALTGDKVRIGRAEDLDMWINHRSISREHAEVQKEPDGGLRLIDLGSANGVRVNGEDVQNTLLVAGDVVELGQVRFRFVGAGEHYVFEADRTVQMNAIGGESDIGSGRTPILVAIAIVVLAVIGAIVVAFWGGGDETVVTPLDGPEIAQGQQESDPYTAALAGCNAAVRDQNAARAVEQANAALVARPEDSAANACLARAQTLGRELETFQSGLRALNDRDVEAAWTAFMSLPDASPLRQRPEVSQAARTLANFYLREGQRALTEGDNAAALAKATQVLGLAGITVPQRTQAEQLRTDAQAAGAGDPVETNPPQVVEPPPIVAHNTGGRGRRSGSGRRRRGSDNNTTTPPPDQGSGGSGRSSGTTPPTRGPSNAERLAEARACARVGNNDCVVRQLRGHATTPDSMALLIATYRARTNMRQAVPLMRRYIERFPSNGRSQAYRQLLQAQGQ